MGRRRAGRRCRRGGRRRPPRRAGARAPARGTSVPAFSVSTGSPVAPLAHPPATCARAQSCTAGTTTTTAPPVRPRGRSRPRERSHAAACAPSYGGPSARSTGQKAPAFICRRHPACLHASRRSPSPQPQPQRSARGERGENGDTALQYRAEDIVLPLLPPCSERLSIRSVPAPKVAALLDLNCGCGVELRPQLMSFQDALRTV
eukprot:7253500-Prymnesium_polylepis.1